MSGEWTKLACAQYLRYEEKTAGGIGRRLGTGILAGGATAGALYLAVGARGRAQMSREVGDPRLKENVKNMLLLKSRDERVRLLNKKYPKLQRADGVKTAVISPVGAVLGGGLGYFGVKHLPGDYRKRKAGLPPNLAFHYAKNQQQRYAPMHGSFY